MDFIALETLASIYIESVRDTFFLFRDLANVQPDLEMTAVSRNALGEVVQAAKRPDYTQAAAPVPLFRVQASLLSAALKGDFDHEGIPLRAYRPVKVVPFDDLNQDYQTFDPLVHIELREVPNQGDLTDLGDSSSEDEEERGPLERPKVDGLHEHWLLVEPS